MKDWTGNSRSGYILNGISRDANHEREKHDFYATDPHSVNLFLQKIEQDGIILPKTIYEPAPGQEHISQELKRHGYNVISSDLYNYGYGTSEANFLQSTEEADCFRASAL